MERLNYLGRRVYLDVFVTEQAGRQKFERDLASTFYRITVNNQIMHQDYLMIPMQCISFL